MTDRARAGCANVRARWLGGRLARRAATLSGGTLLAQLTLVASSPIITRLYGPAPFGTFAVFMSVSSIVGMAAALRYEYGVPVAADEEEAAGMVVVAWAAAVAVALLTAVATLLGGGPLARSVGAPDLAPWLWTLPVVTLLTGLALPLNTWSLRRGSFRVNAANKLAAAAAQSGGQLALGAAGAGPAGLVVGYCLGPLVQVPHFLLALTRKERRRLAAVPWRAVWPLARRHWQYPAYSTPASVLNQAVQLLPAVLLAGLYGPAVAGWFALGQRVVGLPVRLLAQAAGDVFLGEVPKLRDDAAVRRLFVRVTVGFAAVGAVGMAPVMLLGPRLFGLAFGAGWRQAGTMAALLVPQHLARFVVTPVSQALNIYGRQDLHLVASGANVAGLAAAFGLAYATRPDPLAAIALYSATTTAAFALYLWFAWRVVRHGGFPGREGDVVSPGPAIAGAAP